MGTGDRDGFKEGGTKGIIREFDGHDISSFKGMRTGGEVGIEGSIEQFAKGKRGERRKGPGCELVSKERWMEGIRCIWPMCLGRQTGRQRWRGRGWQHRVKPKVEQELGTWGALFAREMRFIKVGRGLADFDAASLDVHVSNVGA
jgi:hypothetical protein